MAENYYTKKIAALEAKIAELEAEIAATRRRMVPIPIDGGIPEGYVEIPAIAVVCGVGGYLRVGEYKGMAPDIPLQMHDDDGVAWIAHPNMHKRIVKLEGKRHFLRSDLPSEVDTFHFDPSAFKKVLVRGEKVTTYSVDGALTVAKTKATTPREILEAKGLSPMDYFVTVENFDGAQFQVFDDLDVSYVIQQGDRFATQSLSEIDQADDAGDPEAEQTAERYRKWVERNQKRARRGAA